MCVGWRRVSTESAGDGEKRLWLTGLNRCDATGNIARTIYFRTVRLSSYRASGHNGAWDRHVRVKEIYA